MIIITIEAKGQAGKTAVLNKLWDYFNNIEKKCCVVAIDDCMPLTFFSMYRPDVVIFDGLSKEKRRLKKNIMKKFNIGGPYGWKRFFNFRGI